MKTRAFLVSDFGQVELPNHQTAIENLDFTNLRLRMEWSPRDFETASRVAARYWAEVVRACRL